ncbi:PREDICTED: tRNA wybutosine-synthesizing protein 3 homolog [Nanorana parkeri]|uniref:tRNA wybutosine-synthesizing protein 3 homolog n=1 Tax=Nanorana parkeri TaxID=125878 RepID=UPI0008549F7E|nr:PREDICTED: tRNA wybutosine-synthesizing protein 3 homolog [Nanorana parkeri]
MEDHCNLTKTQTSCSTMETESTTSSQQCQNQSGSSSLVNPKTLSNSKKQQTLPSIGPFAHWKLQASLKIDLSKKGSVDKDIEEIVRHINLQDCYFTTSSCSGRIIIIDENPNHSIVQKENCLWLFVTHDLCSIDDVVAALQKTSGDAVLKFEPFVMHVQCRTLEDAQLLHSVAINSAFRNSGITVGKKGKIIMAVRSTHCLEVPLSHKGKCLVSNEYIEYLVQTANQKMEENKTRIARFFSCLQTALQKRDGMSDKDHKGRTDSSVYTRRRRRQEVAEAADDSLSESPDDPETGISFLHDKD